MTTDINIKLKKKILIIHHSGYIGGAGLSLLHILKALKALSLEVTVYCPDKPDQMVKEIKKIGYKCISDPSTIPIISHFSGSDRFILNYHTIRNILDIIKNLASVKRLIKQVSPDIIAVNSMTLSYVGKIAKSLGINIICFHRETYAKGFLGVRTNYIKKSLSNDFDKVVFISNFDHKESGELKSCTYVVRDKVIMEEFVVGKNDYKDDILKLSEDAFTILYTGGMSELKGAHVIIEALAKCKSNIHLIFLQYDGLKNKRRLLNYSGIKNKLRYMFGKDYTARVLSLIDKYQLWNKVHFYPVTNNVAIYFQLCDIVVFPSTSPHQARPIYEAGAACKPIIITDSQNIREFVTDGENGYVFKNGDSSMLADLADKLANNHDLTKLMGNKNYLMTMDKHNFSTLKDELLKVFRM